ncbi:MAG: hypothetical protein ABW025_00260 [Cellulomonas sp.]
MNTYPPRATSDGGSVVPGTPDDPWLRAARRRELPVLIGVVAFGALLVAFGPESAPVVVLGAWIIGVGALLLAARAVRDRQEQGHGPRGAITLAKLDGEQATVLGEHGVRGLLAAGLTAWPGALFLAAAAFGAGDAMSSGLTVVVALVGLGFVVAGARQANHVRRNGVWLTPSGLTVRDRDQAYRVGWQDVAAVNEPPTSTALVVVLARDSSAVTVTGRERKNFPRGPRSQIPVRAEASALDAPALARVLDRVRADPDRRWLGTQGSRETVLRLARG